MTTTLERLNLMYGELFARKICTSQKELADMIGANESTISSAFSNNHGKLTIRLLVRINAASGNIFNSEWVRSGEGSMLSVKSPMSVTEYHMPGATNTNIDSPNAIAGGDIELSMKVAELQGKLADKEAESAELKAEVASLREENMQLKIDNARMQGRLDVLANK